ncbi:30S ribosomal protein S10 [Candidatus Mesenet endosymbiont of Agriotes lineatus]|uniref:30S ribosomal protein S10 n=1 Tax=Candidatus Mesenet endosymbiont of Agriotes lineatus TaxID=3077948 RepID=UPI0030CC21DC
MVNADKNQVYIIIKAFDSKCLERNVVKLVSSFNKLGIKFKGPVYLPTKHKHFTFKRSPHVDKKSQEQYKRDGSKRLILLNSFDFNNAVQRLDDDLSLSSGVEVSFKTKDK